MTLPLRMDLSKQSVTRITEVQTRNFLNFLTRKNYHAMKALQLHWIGHSCCTNTFLLLNVHIGVLHKQPRITQHTLCEANKAAVALWRCYYNLQHKRATPAFPLLGKLFLTHFAIMMTCACVRCNTSFHSMTETGLIIMTYTTAWFAFFKKLIRSPKMFSAKMTRITNVRTVDAPSVFQIHRSWRTLQPLCYKRVASDKLEFIALQINELFH